MTNGVDKMLRLVLPLSILVVGGVIATMFRYETHAVGSRVRFMIGGQGP